MDEEIDGERTAIRKELSEMSFEDLIKLKERLGTKVYDEAMYGSSSSKNKDRPPRAVFKRTNKDKPLEMSSKVPVSPFIKVVPVKKTAKTRDPRFESLCGRFDERVFRKAYKFVDSIRSDEKEQLKQELQDESDPKRKAEIKYLIQRMENQEREQTKRNAKEEQEKAERQERMEMMRRGEKPHYPRKSERKAKELVNMFEELKQSGKLKKHIEKKQKKFKVKDRKRLEEME